MEYRLMCVCVCVCVYLCKYAPICMLVDLFNFPFSFLFFPSVKNSADAKKGSPKRSVDGWWKLSALDAQMMMDLPDREDPLWDGRVRKRSSSCCQFDRTDFGTRWVDRRTWAPSLLSAAVSVTRMGVMVATKSSINEPNQSRPVWYRSVFFNSISASTFHLLLSRFVVMNVSDCFSVDYLSQLNSTALIIMIGWKKIRKHVIQSRPTDFKMIISYPIVKQIRPKIGKWRHRWNQIENYRQL